eukprot:Sro1323_g262660.2  (473) ;mRNA; r:15123-16541
MKQAYSKARSLTCETGEMSSQTTSSASSSFRDEEEDQSPQSSRDVSKDVNQFVVVMDKGNEDNDCPSSFKEEKAVKDEDGDLFFDSVDPEYEIAVYVDGMTVYPSDGRPAFVPPGLCSAKIPDDFLEMADFDPAEARVIWEKCKQWRKEQKIWSIHTRPNHRFHHAKQYYPSCYYGVSKDGYVLEYSFPGQMQPKALFPEKGVIDEMLDHHCFMAEYSANCLYTDRETWQLLGREPLVLDLDNPSPTSKGLIMVMDVKGTGPHLLDSKVFTFLTRMAAMSEKYFPVYLDRVLVINSPFWVAGVFATIKPFLPDILPVEIVSVANTLDTLRKYVDDDHLPMQYGGSCPYPMHEHPLECRLHQAVAEAAAYGTTSENEKKNNDKPKDSSPTPTVASSPASSFEEDDEKDPSNATTRAGCLRVPFCGEVEDSNVDVLTLAPQRPGFDLVSVTRQFWTSLVTGFPCGGKPRSTRHS